tara:strand:- start:672 stop:998 length:327 start_codon:yes stop_codon:yes gene_type:complete
MTDTVFHSVVPTNEDLEQIFVDRINHIIKRKNDMAAADADVKATFASLAENYADKFEKAEQGAAKKFAKAECTLIVNEFMKGVIDDKLNELESAEVSYNRIKDKLTDM